MRLNKYLTEAGEKPIAIFIGRMSPPTNYAIQLRKDNLISNDEIEEIKDKIHETYMSLFRLKKIFTEIAKKVGSGKQERNWLIDYMGKK